MKKLSVVLILILLLSALFCGSGQANFLFTFTYLLGDLNYTVEETSIGGIGSYPVADCGSGPDRDQMYAIAEALVNNLRSEDLPDHNNERIAVVYHMEPSDDLLGTYDVCHYTADSGSCSKYTDLSPYDIVDLYNADMRAGGPIYYFVLSDIQPMVGVEAPKTADSTPVVLLSVAAALSLVGIAAIGACHKYA